MFRQLSPIVTVAITVVAIAAAVVSTVGATVSAFVAIAVGLFVVAFVAHPVLVTAGVFPVVVFEFEAAASFRVELPLALAVIEATMKAVLARFVTAVVIVVVVTIILAPSDAAAGDGHSHRQGCHSDPTPHPVAHHSLLCGRSGALHITSDPIRRAR